MWCNTLWKPKRPCFVVVGGYHEGMRNLTQEEINRRMIQWRNDRRLEPERKKRMQELEERCAWLERENAQQKILIEKLLLRIEQLEIMVFGRKKNRDDHDNSFSMTSTSSGASAKTSRTSASYRRQKPKPEEVTARKEYLLRDCPDCGNALSRKALATRFVEDIPLSLKTVTELTIERGFCFHCKKMKSGFPMTSQDSTLGLNVRMYVLFAVTVLGQTFEKIRTYLMVLHNLSISDGEIADIIQEGHQKLLPAMKQIEENIRQAPAAHYDETTWPMQHTDQGNFAWVKTSASSHDTIFRLGRSRGKGNAKELRGDPSDQVGVSDDYGGYDYLFKNHALCWAHPLRKFRDLARSEALSEERHDHCLRFYEEFHALERKVALTIAAPLSEAERKEAVMRFGNDIDRLMMATPLDPPILTTLKTTFLQHREKYLLCLRLPGVPMTNNKAERSLRHLVIKRLISFGSRTQKGARAMETLLSVLLTLWWSKPKNYFGDLARLMQLQG